MATDGTHSHSTESPTASSESPSRTETSELEAYVSPTADFLLLFVFAVALTAAVAGGVIFMP
ncbi:hypothetical protein OB955_01955 [Halobacteria archaeon AArc-m2/3/4]|uniref:Uncharacterized protein n=1 Tax=Natronoglomus mannanivorans TaxID=2979990 RepID=A0AAP3E0R8_9EURY|nr:hypothetical protein [Halobacteria archaeon AArc-xg1-1]MCU4971506.1 hypothetical protein [Halobacteria archaeon AArc-m2/3/4]